MIWIAVILSAFGALVVVLVVCAQIRMRFFYPHKDFLREIRRALGPGCRFRLRKTFFSGHRRIPGLDFQRDGFSFFIGVLEYPPLEDPGPEIRHDFESIEARILEPISNMEVVMDVVCPFEVNFFPHDPSWKRPTPEKLEEFNARNSVMTELQGHVFLTGDHDFDAHVLALSAKPEDTRERIRRFGLFDPVRELVRMKGLGGVGVHFHKNGLAECMCMLTHRITVDHVQRMAEILSILHRDIYGKAGEGPNVDQGKNTLFGTPGPRDSRLP